MNGMISADGWNNGWTTDRRWWADNGWWTSGSRSRFSAALYFPACCARFLHFYRARTHAAALPARHTLVVLRFFAHAPPRTTLHTHTARTARRHLFAPSFNAFPIFHDDQYHDGRADGDQRVGRRLLNNVIDGRFITHLLAAGWISSSRARTLPPSISFMSDNKQQYNGMGISSGK